VTSPASGAGSGSNLPDCVPTTRSTQSETWRTASPAATTSGGGRLGPALLFIATAQLIVVLDATIMIIALLHIQRAPGFSGSGLPGVFHPPVDVIQIRGCRNDVICHARPPRSVG
jgi:hypothetical protein